MPRARTISPVREKVWNKSLIPGICRQAELGVPQRLIAIGLNVAPTTFSEWLSRYPELRVAFQAARIRGVEARLTAIKLSQAGGKYGNHDWKADAWMLSRMFPQDFADPSKQIEVHNSTTTNVSVTVVSAERLKEIQSRRTNALKGAHGRN